MYSWAGYDVSPKATNQNKYTHVVFVNKTC